MHENSDHKSNVLHWGASLPLEMNGGHENERTYSENNTDEEHQKSDDNAWRTPHLSIWLEHVLVVEGVPSWGPRVCLTFPSNGGSQYLMDPGTIALTSAFHMFCSNLTSVVIEPQGLVSGTGLAPLYPHCLLYLNEKLVHKTDRPDQVETRFSVIFWWGSLIFGKVRISSQLVRQKFGLRSGTGTNSST